MDLPPALVGFLIVIACSSFVKIVTSLSILRFGLGLNGLGFGLVTTVLAFVLSLIAIEPQLSNVGGVNSLFSNYSNVNLEQWEQRFGPFLDSQTREGVRDRIQLMVSRKTSEKAAAAPEEHVSGSSTLPAMRPSFAVRLASFLISQIHDAFRLGLLFIIPFIVLDLLVANTLVALGMREFSYQVVSLPLKLLLFFSVDGWTLVSTKLLGGYF